MRDLVLKVIQILLQALHFLCQRTCQLSLALKPLFRRQKLSPTCLFRLSFTLLQLI